MFDETNLEAETVDSSHKVLVPDTLGVHLHHLAQHTPPWLHLAAHWGEGGAGGAGQGGVIADSEYLDEEGVLHHRHGLRLLASFPIFTAELQWLRR